MNDPNDPQPSPHEPQPPLVIPVRYTTAPAPAPPPPVGPSPIGALVRTFLMLVLALSLGLNMVFLLFSFSGLSVDESNVRINERFHSGDSKAKDKVAVVKLDGVILEGATSFVQKEIEAAATDGNVKAVVFRIISPGGSITASDDLYCRMKELAQDKYPHQKGGKKPVVVSMGAMAASGGYYVAMPGEYIFAERTTLTGSIGVYASFPNVKGLADKYGVGMNLIKAGAMKDSGSMFHDMTPQEKRLWQDMVDNAYDQFLAVVEEGRPQLAGQMTEIVLRGQVAAPREPNEEEPKLLDYTRYRADGGVFTAADALKFGLIDEIGTQDDAIQKAKELAKLGDTYKVVTYERPPSLSNLLLGGKANEQAKQPDLGRLSSLATPRLWYMAPQSELAGILSALGQ
jgi:protease-4